MGNLLLLFQINSLYIHCPVSTVYLHNAQEGGPYSDMISLYIHSDQLLFLKNQLYADHWGESKTPVDATSFYLVESEPPPLSPSQSPFMNPSKFCIIKFLRAGTSIEFYIAHTPPNSPKIFYSTFLNIQV